MFLNRKSFLVTIKEKEIKRDKDGAVSSVSYHPVNLLNIKDIRAIEESSKKNFPNPTNVEDVIAEPILVLKSFEKNRIYICSWHYEDLKKEIQKVIDGDNSSAFSVILEDISINYNNKIEIDNKNFLDEFANNLKDELLNSIEYKK